MNEKLRMKIISSKKRLLRDWMSSRLTCPVTFRSELDISDLISQKKDFTLYRVSEVRIDD